MGYTFDLDIYCDNCKKTVEKDDSIYCDICYEGKEDEITELEDKVVEYENEIERLKKELNKYGK